ncbi:MAG: hypothetical protein IPN76_32380 [Saprospiraceae bacterium]|nr:hypothetical protein [Saprospiraceae bacterium]
MLHSTSKDLWGEFNFKEIEPSPVDLLREQANLLDEKTHNILRGELVTTSVTPNGSKQPYQYHVFNIVAPKLRNRRKELIRYVHKADAYFPATMTIIEEDGARKIEITNAKQFEKRLAEVLSSSTTKQQLQNLIMASRQGNSALK